MRCSNPPHHRATEKTACPRCLPDYLVPQGEYVADSLKDYLERHPEMGSRCSRQGQVHYLTTENPDKFKESAEIFLHESIDVDNITLDASR